MNFHGRNYRISTKSKETGAVNVQYAKTLKEAQKVYDDIDSGKYLKNLFSRQGGLYRKKEFDEIL